MASSGPQSSSARQSIEQAPSAPLANRATKRFLRRLADPRPLTAAETAEAYALCDSSDYAEGLAAFLAKRKPKFEGR